MNKVITSLFLLCCVIASKAATAQQNHLLTGVIASDQQQLVSVPKSRSWQLQIQWMAEEGIIVNKGDLIVVFDSGSIQTELEQSEERLEMENLELQQIEMRLNQTVIEAQGRLKLAKIMVNKSQVQASIPDGEISAYEKGKHVIAYEKSLVEKIKAEENYKLKLEEQKVGIEKQKIEIIKLVENIEYQSSQLERMKVVAKFSGPVSHMMHPHLGGKIAAGMNVQTSWKVLVVQAQSAYQVKTWVHELDAARIDFEQANITLSLDAYPGKKYPGKVLGMSSQAELKKDWSESAYYALDIGFSKDVTESIFPGMSVRIDITENASQITKVNGVNTND